MVAFRGSSTAQDWKADLNPAMKIIENPVDQLKGEIPTIQIHEGFYNYLFKPTVEETQNSTPGSENSKTLQNAVSRLCLTKSNSMEEQPQQPTKCDIILQKIEGIFEEYPDYRLYTTGHSLG